MDNNENTSPDILSGAGEAPDELDSFFSDEAAAAEDDTAPENTETDGGDPDNEASGSEESAPQTSTITDIKRSAVKAADFFKTIGLPDMLLLRFITAFFFFSAFDIPTLRKDSIDPINNWRDFVPQVDGFKTFLLIAFVCLGLSLIYWMLPKKYRVTDQTLAIASIIYFDITVLWCTNNFHLTFSVLLVSLVFIYYAIGKLRRITMFNRVSWKLSAVAVLLLSVLVCAFVAVTTVNRHWNYSTASHDFGIFVQMYYSLADNMTAVTTCERNEPLSHFLVHASYIFYVLVPIFKLFPKPETLLIAQAVLAMGGIIPMFLIAKRHNIKGISLFFISLSYVFCNGLIGPCYYEFHENCFLPTLLMWLLWAVDAKKYTLFYIMSVLVCLVKEDAPLYIICIGLYIFYEEKGKLSRINGIISAVLAGAYMIFITGWLTSHGDGQMMTSTRFGLLMIDNSGGLREVVKNVMLDPAYFFSLFIHEDTLPFFLQLLIPMLFIPFFTKKLRRFLFMLPMVIMNMVIGAGYGYAASMGYQYVYGPVCLLLYMSILNLDDLGKEKKQELPVLMGTAAVIMSIGMFSHNINIVKSHREAAEYYDQVDAMLESIPTDASVGANAFYCPHISNRRELYVFDNSGADLEAGTLKEPEKFDFLVIPAHSELSDALEKGISEQGFILFDEIPDHIIVYAKESYLAEHS